MGSVDFAALTEAVESRDANTLIDMYADDAEIRIVNKSSPPSSPRVVQGKDAIADYLRDVCGREMTHEIENEVIGADRVSYTEACEYPDGTRVLMAAVAEVNSEGKIASQLTVETWDE